LRAAGLLSLIGTYADRSGPNCFGLAAAFAAAKGDGRSAWLHERWLHPAPFFSRLATAGYRKRSYDGSIGIWVVERGNEAVHAAINLGNEWVFEKPGQSFYEPYRLLRRQDLRAEWPRHRISFYGQ
jgi:hypothetical protein